MPLAHSAVLEVLDVHASDQVAEVVERADCALLFHTEARQVDLAHERLPVEARELVLDRDVEQPRLGCTVG